MTTVEAGITEMQDIEAVLSLPTYTIKLIEQIAKEHDSNPAEVAAMWLVAFGALVESGVVKPILDSCDHENLH